MLKSIWNFCDLCLLGLYIAYIPVSFISLDDAYETKSLQVAIIFFISIKMNFYLRIFEQMGHMVQMIQTVFYDLKFFLLYYCIIISFFSIQVSLIFDITNDEDPTYPGIGPMEFFVRVLRTSLGDNDLDQSNSEEKILFWVIWLLIMFVGNIVLMNFIIAVVGESYEACMTKRVAQSYKGRVDMIVEREQIMTQSEFGRKEWFPNYILVRRPVS